MLNQELLNAVQRGDIKSVEAILEQYPSLDLNQLDDTGRPLVLWATQERHIGILHLLIKHGANLNLADEGGSTPLTYAASCGDAALVKKLVDLGANVNMSGSCGTALHSACAYESVEVCELLLSYGADVNVVDNEGWTPLFFAVSSQNVTIVKILRRHEAKVEYVDNDGKSVFEIAKEARDKANIKANEIERLISQ